MLMQIFFLKYFDSYNIKKKKEDFEVTLTLMYTVYQCKKSLEVGYTEYLYWHLPCVYNICLLWLWQFAVPCLSMFVSQSPHLAI